MDNLRLLPAPADGAPGDGVVAVVPVAFDVFSVEAVSRRVRFVETFGIGDDGAAAAADSQSRRCNSSSKEGVSAKSRFRLSPADAIADEVPTARACTAEEDDAVGVARASGTAAEADFKYCTKTDSSAMEGVNGSDAPGWIGGVDMEIIVGAATDAAAAAVRAALCRGEPVVAG